MAYWQHHYAWGLRASRGSITLAMVIPAIIPTISAYLRQLGVDGYRLSEVRRKRFEYSGLQQGPEEAGEAAYLASQAVEKIGEYAKSDRPFFISCNFSGPHTRRIC